MSPANKVPKKFFVTHHRGAISWFARTGQRAQKIEMDHFDVGLVQPGNIVIGTLPPQVAAEVCARGGRYWHLTLDLPPGHRGRVQTADEMETFNARLEEFHIQSMGSRRSYTDGIEDADGPPDAPSRPVCHVCVATEATMANLLPALQLSWDQLIILVTPAMAQSAGLLEMLVRDEADRRGLSQPAQRARQVSLQDSPSIAAMRRESRRVLAQIRQDFPGHDLVVNVTGGLKPIYQAIVDEFRPFARLVYCHLEHDLIEAVSPIAPTPQSLKPDLVDLETLLAAQNSRIVEQASVDAARLAQMRSRMRLTASLALGPTRTLPQDAPFVAALHAWASDAKGQQFAGAVANAWTSPIAPFSVSPWGASVLRELVGLGLIAPTGAAGNEFRISNAEAAAYLSGAYMEEFAYLSAHDLDLPDGHLGMNVSISSLVAQFGRPDAYRLNEVDVFVVWRNRLLVIECKAGGQLLQRTSEPQNIANKIGALKAEKAGRFGSAWLLSRLSPDPAWHAQVFERLDKKGVELLSGYRQLQSLPKRLRDWCGLPPKVGAVDWAAYRL